jgi:hypothetical protein
MVFAGYRRAAETYTQKQLEASKKTGIAPGLLFVTLKFIGSDASQRRSYPLRHAERSSPVPLSS